MNNKEFKNISDLTDYILTEKEIFYNLIIEHIELRLVLCDNKEIFAVFLILDVNEKVVLSLSEDVWVDTLNKALKFFELNEDYEKCHDINLLINKINGR